MPFISLAGDKYLLVVFCLLLFVFGRNKLRESAALAFLSLFAAGLLSELLKKAICRLRPAYVLSDIRILNDIPLFSKGHSPYGFPSGHATAIFAVATIFSAKYPGYKWAFLSVAALVGFSRVYAGMHFPSDVLGGAALGASLALLALGAEKRVKARLKSRV